MQSQTNVDSARGFGFALAAYVLWGFLPLYMKLLSHISTLEVLVHRVIWSIPIAGAVLWALGRTDDLVAALKSPRTLAMGAITAMLISLNWGLYIWAIASGHALDAALGYYINPLFSVLLGAILLGERLNKAKVLAILLALAAVIVLTLDAQRFPTVAVGLTLTWGLYAYFKKSLPIGPNQGFLLEVLLLAPPALAYAIYLSIFSHDSHFLRAAPMDTWLLLGCGVVTAVPLMLYANGAKFLRLSTIGMMQYMVPTMIFLVAVFMFGEELGKARMIAFPMIWLALIIYTTSLLREARAVRKSTKPLDLTQIELTSSDK